MSRAALRALFKYLEKIKHSPVIIVDRYNHMGGADYSVRNYCHYRKSQGKDLIFHEFLLKHGTVKLFLIGMFGKSIIINSLRQMLYIRILLIAFMRPGTCLYLHETGWIFDKIKVDSPIRYRIVIAAIKRINVLCVSQAQFQWLKDKFGITKARVVYETIGDRYRVPEEKLSNIVMVGSVQARKGVTLFSKVADLALSLSLPYRFVWVGGGDFDNDNLYFSANVSWLGHKDASYVDRLLGNAAVFFLSSVDDPFPLSIFEALDNGVRCICYAKVGTSEVLRNIPGCAVFDDYNEHAALAAVRKVSEEPFDGCAAKQIVDKIVGISEFSSRLDAAIESL